MWFRGSGVTMDFPEMVNLPSFEFSMKVGATVVVRFSDGRNSGFIEEVVGSKPELVAR
jgi:hypothetical protein